MSFNTFFHIAEAMERRSRSKESRKGEYEVYAYYGANCAECPFRSECAGEGKIRAITSDGYEGERRRMAAKMRSMAGKETYKKRKETVEWLAKRF